MTQLFRLIWPKFLYPKNAKTIQLLEACYGRLYAKLGRVTVIDMVDFMICQVYACSRFDKSYIQRWNVSHSLGQRALSRFFSETSSKKYYEDLWLQSYGLNRPNLVAKYKNFGQHPYQKFIYPEYEDVTKLRLLSTEAGYFICALSTLMWTPFSPVCQRCLYAEKCKRRTLQGYPDLYRIRVLAFSENGRNGYN